MGFPIPTIGMKGVYSLKAPFDQLLIAQAEYTCRAVRQLNDFVLNQEDPLTTIYLANGLTEVDYQLDLSEDMVIVSLQAGVGQWIIVPGRYVLGYPDTGGVPYHGVLLGVNIGAMPVNADLSVLESSISNLVYDQIGLRPHISPVQISNVTLVPYEDHTALLTARQARVTMQLSDSGRVAALQQQLDSALTRIQVLEKYIKDRLL